MAEVGGSHRETETPASRHEAPKAGPGGETPASRHEAPKAGPGGQTHAPRHEAPKNGPGGQTHAPRREAAKTPVAGETEQLVLTLDVATGEIVNVEKLDRSGHRHELTEAEYAELAADDVTDELEATFEEAYETAVADALGEDAEELALRRLVGGHLLVRGMLRHELGRQLLRRAIRRQVVKRGMLRRSVGR
jgi:hypothetical protein